METLSPPPEAQQWWVLRWIDLLEKYRFKKRLERGRNYAKEGNVLSIEFAGTQVSARVQGTADDPYDLTVGLDAFTDADWDHTIATLASRAAYAAQLLDGQMPDDIEAVFAESGLSLFPFNLTEVRSRCSCPDPKNPCKHIAAVYYLLGDRFSDDPFVLFQLRGRSREQVLAQIRLHRARVCQESVAPETDTPPPSQAAAAAEPTVAAAPSPERFWQYRESLETALAQPATVEATTNAEPFERLGSIPLPDAPALQQYFDRAYSRIRQQGNEGNDESA